MNDGLLFVLVCLVAYRLWRLLVLDTLPLIASPRVRLEDWIERRHGSDWSGGLACAWCSGFWVSCAVVAAVWASRPLPLPALWFAAVSSVVGLVATTVED